MGRATLLTLTGACALLAAAAALPGLRTAWEAAPRSRISPDGTPFALSASAHLAVGRVRSFASRSGVSSRRFALRTSRFSKRGSVFS